MASFENKSFHSTQYFWARSLRATSLWFKASYKIWYEAPSALDCFQCKSVLNPFSTKSSLSLSMAVISGSVTFKRRPSFLQAAPISVPNSSNTSLSGVPGLTETKKIK